MTTAKKILLLAGVLLALTRPVAGEADRPALIRPVVNRDYLPCLLDLIAGAERSIEFVQLEFHYDPEVKKVQDALRAARERGVKVRGLIEDDISFNRTSHKYLNQFGIETRLDTPAKMLHNKLFVADGKKVLLGSSNLSANSILNNNETNIYVEDKPIGAFFREYFEQLWAESSREPRDESVRGPLLRTVINRQHFPVLAELITEAKSRIWVVMYGMSYNARYADSQPNRLIDSLIEAAGRGVEVRVVLDESDYNQGINQVNRETAARLEKGGVKVRLDLPEVTTHAKLVIADDRVLVGSANWGHSALAIRNESSLLVSEPETAAFFARYFQALWEKGTYPGEKASGPAPWPGPTEKIPCPQP